MDLASDLNGLVGITHFSFLQKEKLARAQLEVQWETGLWEVWGEDKGMSS